MLSLVVTVSVIVPSLNDAELLATCLAALAVQSRPADEVIVVDNGSTDATAAVAAAAGATVVHESTRGTMPATAAGFDAARGQVLARLDADSVPPPDWVQQVATAFEADPQLAALTGPGEFYGRSRALHWFAETVYIGGYRWFVGGLLGHQPLFGSNLALRAAAWAGMRSRVHRDRQQVHDDLELSIHLAPDMPVRFDPRLRVGVSARPFDSLRGLGRRVGWAWLTYTINRDDGSLARRRAEYRAWRAAQREA